MGYVLDLGEVTKDSLHVVGGKNANLGEMLRKGIRVPPGFAVTTDCYLHFLEKTAIQAKLFSILDSIDPADLDVLDQASAQVREMIVKSPIPEDIAAAIKESYLRMSQSMGKENMPVAVRSSATAEDLPTASFAGQQDTYLWVRGAGDVLAAVRRCWASLFTARAISYRAQHHFPHEKVLISVGVQKMVNAKAAGVMFTLNPVNGDPSQVVIEGSWGLGETVVSGNVTPDHFRVDKIIKEITCRKISCKHVQCVPVPESKGVKEIAVAPERQSISCLEDCEIMELVKIARGIEDHYGYPQDIEWAIDQDLPFPENIFIVQNRPETVWSRKRSEPLLARKSCQELLLERASKITRLS
jgi:pyruvate,water dikinase